MWHGETAAGVPSSVMMGMFAPVVTEVCLTKPWTGLFSGEDLSIPGGVKPEWAGTRTHTHRKQSTSVIAIFSTSSPAANKHISNVAISFPTAARALSCWVRCCRPTDETQYQRIYYTCDIPLILFPLTMCARTWKPFYTRHKDKRVRSHEIENNWRKIEFGSTWQSLLSSDWQVSTLNQWCCMYNS